MRAPLLGLALLASVAFSLASCLEPWFHSWKGSRTRSDSLLQTALGDGRRLFASHFYAKADAYFHNGYYPTVFDNNDGFDKAHIAEDMHKGAAEDEAAENFLGRPGDWIDAFGRHFFPSHHSHLGETASGHHDPPGLDRPHDAREADEREILPWLRLSAELDPERVETYVVCAYWLRTALHKPDEAEHFLREGLQANPRDPELLFELGRIYLESRKDVLRARNVWELALAQWHIRETRTAEPNQFLHAQILGQLALLEDNAENHSRALEHLVELKSISPNKDSIQKWIDEVAAKPGR